jgi:cobalt-zinc-cadmium efflux system outer membrane protein
MRARRESGTRIDETPAFGRSFRGLACAALLVLAGRAPLARADAVDEATILARMRAVAVPDNAAAQAAVAVARSESVRASSWPNPSLGWQREHLGAPSEPQDAFELTLPLPLGGNRGAQRALVQASVESSRAQAALTRSEATARALEAFYAALGADREAAILEAAVARLDEAVRVATHRHEQGAISGYERTRLELETELVRSELQAAKAAARSWRATLAAMLGMESASLELRGELAVRGVDTTAQAQAPASVQHLRAAEQRAREAHDDADLGYLPELALRGGLQRQEVAGRDTRYGYVAGVSVSLPLFSHGQDIAAESSARAAWHAAEADAAERRAHTGAAGAEGRLRAAQEELQRFAAATAARVELIERAAASAYRDGNATVVELVDAQRARTEVERQQLALQLRARAAELELRAARGAFE